jgi:dTDP-4-amino-4,6-dideoxygalactose transaminase
MFRIVENFQRTIADYFGAPYAVATDSCTHAIELCLRHLGAKKVASPEWTYLSVPMTFIKLGLDWQWQDIKWTQNYTIPGTNIVDAATQWEENGYQSGTFMCISFQHQKHLSLGRGGMILCDNEQDCTVLSKMSYDGRHITTSWYEQNIDTVGYHYYMTPETAQLGLAKFATVRDQAPVIWNWQRYRYLPELEVFQNVSNQ